MHPRFTFNEGRLSKKRSWGNELGRCHVAETDLDLYIIARFDYDTPLEETDITQTFIKEKVPGAWRICDVWISVLQYAGGCKESWMDTIFSVKSLQSLYEDEELMIPICKQMNVS